MTRARDLANIADGTFTATDLDLSGTLTVSGDATFDTNTLFVDVSTNRVGIGTTSPATELEVKSDGAAIQVSSADYDVALLGRRGSSGVDLDKGYMRLRDTGTTKVAIDSAGDTYFNGGNVGIGTSSPATKLAVSGGYISQTDGTRTLYLGSDGTGGLFGTTTDHYLRFVTNNTERMRIDSSGNVGIGTSSPNASLHISQNPPVLALGSTGSSDPRFDFYDQGTTTIAASLFLDQSEDMLCLLRTASGNATDGMRIDSSGNLLVGVTGTSSSVAGTVIYGGSLKGVITHTYAGRPLYINRLSTDGAIIELAKDGTVVGVIGSQTLSTNPELFIGNGSNIGLAFEQTGSDRIFPCNGSTGAEQDATIDLGSSSARFVDAFIINGVTTGSDGRDKQDIAELDEAERRVAVACKGLLRKWRWKDAVAEKGDDARIHFGIIAQDLQAAFEAEGLDAGRYGMFIHSTWTDEETGEERSRMGVRYSELLAFIIAAL